MTTSCEKISKANVERLAIEYGIPTTKVVPRSKKEICTDIVRLNKQYKKEVVCNENQIINPATGKCVSKDGKIGRKLLGRSPLKRKRSSKRKSPKGSPRGDTPIMRKVRNLFIADLKPRSQRKRLRRGKSVKGEYKKRVGFPNEIERVKTF